jgi:hypothetical protein
MMMAAMMAVVVVVVMMMIINFIMITALFSVILCSASQNYVNTALRKKN